MSEPSRLAKIPRDDLTPAQKEMDDMVRGIFPPGKKPVMYDAHEDLVYGPFPPFVRYPDVGKHWVGMGLSVLKIGGGLPPKVQDVGILRAAEKTQWGYVS